MRLSNSCARSGFHFARARASPSRRTASVGDGCQPSVASLFARSPGMKHRSRTTVESRYRFAPAPPLNGPHPRTANRGGEGAFQFRNAPFSFFRHAGSAARLALAPVRGRGRRDVEDPLISASSASNTEFDPEARDERDGRGGQRHRPEQALAFAGARRGDEQADAGPDHGARERAAGTTDRRSRGLSRLALILRDSERMIAAPAPSRP